ncbi:aldehyde dehydrogenase family protein [Amycolatopsis acidiphila]|uniref:Aldehyde dehydrogenase family protein n=1 Tax=Amycolatopsis acidiphila TaxID=715473 RepID=A0A558AJC1_9PSEU|nr:aldehyde dehydrogenase family protein [Amycolatopsis acidiphila]UIJ63841.1 aldehyde dehydrogenase family protein [Amycolatopsis acidiphila]
MTETDRLLPEVRDHLRSAHQLLINGEFGDARDGATFETTDPGNGRTLATVAEAGNEDINLAVYAARTALNGPWGRFAPAERERALLRLADLIEENAPLIAQLETLDNGKPLSASANADIPLTAGHFRYFAGWPSKIEGQAIPTGYPDMHVYTRSEPVGVVGAIIPWNFPLLMAAWKLAPALAAGCTVVLKPAEQTPLTALLLGRLALEAGFPPGVLNVCPGFGGRAGRALVAHPGVDKITFTGSAAVGREIGATAGGELKHVSLELGGKSPNIILADADIETAATAAATAIFFLSGQTCSAGSRLMVQREIYDDVVAAVAEKARELQLGHGLDPRTTLGPLVSGKQLERVTGYLASAERDGAKVVTGGRRAGDALAGGYFVEPTVLADVPDHLTVCRDEIFGPVLVTQAFDTVDELATRANANQYGLAAGVWTNDVRKAHDLARRLQAGTVWINCYNYFDGAVPFGGYKNSGHGRDGGRAALEKFLQTKSVWTNLA